MAGVNIKYHTQGEVFSQLFIYPVRYKDHIDLISPIVGLTTTVPKFILENHHGRIQGKTFTPAEDKLYMGDNLQNIAVLHVFEETSKCLS